MIMYILHSFYDYVKVWNLWNMSNGIYLNKSMSLFKMKRNLFFFLMEIQKIENIVVVCYTVAWEFKKQMYDWID